MVDYRDENVRLMLVVALSVAVLFILVVGVPMMRLFIKGGIPYCQYGDIDGNGRIDSREYQNVPENWHELERGDVNDDGVFDNNDVALIIEYLHGSISQFPVATLQYDTPPYVSSISGKRNGAVGEQFTWYALVNESNGECLKGYMKVVKDGVTMKQFPETNLLPGDTITVSYQPENAGSYEVWCYVTYRYRQAQWWTCEPMVVKVN